MTNAKIDAIIKKYKGESTALVQVLIDIQHENHWLPKGVLERVAKKLDVPLSRVQHAATFYKSLRILPETKHRILVCNGTNCHSRGAQKILDRIYNVAGIKPGESDPEMNSSLDAVTCLGCCGSGPVIAVDGEHYINIDPDKAEQALKKLI